MMALFQLSQLCHCASFAQYQGTDMAGCKAAIITVTSPMRIYDIKIFVITYIHLYKSLYL